MGLEPIRLATHAPQTCLSADSSTTANFFTLLQATIDLFYTISLDFASPFFYFLSIYFYKTQIFFLRHFFCYDIMSKQ